MSSSIAVGPVARSHRGARAFTPIAVALLLLVVSAAAAVAAAAAAPVVTSGAWARKVQEFGPPIRSADCDRCNVQTLFAERIRDIGATMEFVELKDGVGVLYSAREPRDVARLQRAAEWVRGELQRISNDPDSHRLCSYCRASRDVFRQVNREVVRTGQGALFIMRSADPGAMRALKNLMAKAQRANLQAPPPALSR